MHSFRLWIFIHYLWPKLLATLPCTQGIWMTEESNLHWQQVYSSTYVCNLQPICTVFKIYCRCLTLLVAHEHEGQGRRLAQRYSLVWLLLSLRNIFQVSMFKHIIEPQRLKPERPRWGPNWKGNVIINSRLHWKDDEWIFLMRSILFNNTSESYWKKVGQWIYF